jgi:SAM-dependent methyltransferase
MAVPLTNYLTPETEYHGVDIIKKGIKWCNRNISRRYPNFHFHLLNVYNQRYNQGGDYAAGYRLPFEDCSFDFVCINSVFTHMQEEDMTNYLTEISRVLKPKGRCFVTYFLLNKESEQLIKCGKSDHTFKYGQGVARYDDPYIPERAIAFSEQFVREKFASLGLNIEEPIYFGNWSGTTNYVGYQDKIVACKS